MVNSCYSALDFHVEHGREDQVALIYDSPVTGVVKKYSYRELRDLAARCAGGLTRLGVVKGDRVVIYMPMIPEAVIAMLACARIGAIHSVVFGGFAPRELATRIEDAEPRVVISASCGIEVSRIIPYKPLLDTAIGMCTHRPSACVIVQRPEHPAEMQEGYDIPWERIVDAEPVACVPVEATDPLYLLYTPERPGSQKGVLRDNGGHLVALTWSMDAIYGMKPGEVFWAASDIGWVVGHSYMVHAPFSMGAPLSSTRENRLARRTPVRSGGSSSSTAYPSCSVPLRHSVRYEKKTPAGTISGSMTSPGSGCSSLPGSAAIPIPCSGPVTSCMSRLSTTGGRRRPAGQSGRTVPGSACSR